jgi:hypothetical protein
LGEEVEGRGKEGAGVAATLPRRPSLPAPSFHPGATIFLHDAQPHAALLPTRDAILAAARWLTAGAAAGDSLFFAFVGSGADAAGAALAGAGAAGPPARAGSRRGGPSGDGGPASFFLRGGAARAAAADAARGGGWAAGLLACDGLSIAAGELRAALVDGLPAGARLTAAVDAAGGRFALGLPAAASPRPDGWPAWDGGGGPAPPAACAGDALLLAADARGSATGDLAFCLVQAVEQGHVGSVAALGRAMRYAAKNGGGGAPPALSGARRFDLARPFVL